MYYDKTKDNRTRSRAHFVCMNIEFLLKIKLIIEEETNIKFSPKAIHKKYVKSDVYEFETSALKNIVLLYKYLYDDKAPRLKRKEEKFKLAYNYAMNSQRVIKRDSPTFMET